MGKRIQSPTYFIHVAFHNREFPARRSRPRQCTHVPNAHQIGRAGTGTLPPTQKARNIGPLLGRRGVAIIKDMTNRHPKSVRRRLLLLLYENYFDNPLEMLSPEEFINEKGFGRDELIPNIHYLSDRGFVELLTSYDPPLFSAARITAAGIDLVENRLELDLWFPPDPVGAERDAGDVLSLMEKLVQEAEFAPLDGEARRCLLRDIQFLRDEVCRPVERWRQQVLDDVIRWLEEHYFSDAGTVMPSLPPLRRRLYALLAER